MIKLDGELSVLGLTFIGCVLWIEYVGFKIRIMIAIRNM